MRLNENSRLSLVNVYVDNKEEAVLVIIVCREK